jgi:hypothetical protein
MINKLLAQGGNNVNQIFGKITPPPGSQGISNPYTVVSNLMVTGIRLAILIGALMTFVYLLWGAFDWITSEGDSDKLATARKKMTAAVIGLILIFAALTVFSIVTGDILGIIKKGPDGSWNFSIPTLNGNTTPNTPPGACAQLGNSCSSLPCCTDGSGVPYACRGTPPTCQ